MLSKIKELIKGKESNIILTVSIVLIALNSFGAGLLISFSSDDNASIVIQQPENYSASALSAGASAEADADKNENEDEKVFVGSVNSNKYHWPDCPSAKKIAPQNQIWFLSEEEARAAGYVRCGNFDKYRPISE